VTASFFDLMAAAWQTLVNQSLPRKLEDFMEDSEIVWSEGRRVFVSEGHERAPFLQAGAQ
jgi:hypothetical protein